MLLSFRDEISALISGVGKACVSFVKHCICTEPIIICDFFYSKFHEFTSTCIKCGCHADLSRCMIEP
jgi:hypothetical protein